MSIPDTPDTLDTKILVFDGVCVLCSWGVRFVLKHDRKKQFRFAAVQSDAGRSLLIAHGMNPDDPVSFLLLEGGAGYTDSDAVIRVLSHLGGLWRLAGMLRFLPRRLRDSGYRWIARNRYRVFGRREACLVPSPEIADRFIQSSPRR
jgi:predicted DCC family thiol-disulfide oxidoreductase YuxK